MKTFKVKLNQYISRFSSIIITILPIIFLYIFFDNKKLLIIILSFCTWSTIEIYLENWQSNFISATKNHDKNSRNFLIICRNLSVWLSAIYSYFYPSSHLGYLNMYIGASLIFLGSLIRFLSINKLKANFTMNLNAYKSQKIETGGIYCYVRHPSYVGILLIFISFPIMADSLTLAVLIFNVTLATLIYRMNLEENLLLEIKGNVYKQYMKNTYRLFPFIY